MNKIDKASIHIENALTIISDEFYDKEEIKETSKRIAKVWDEMTEGVYKKAPALKWFRSKSNGLIIKGPIEVSFLCIHHLLPSLVKILIGYVPNGYVIGLSKITRNVIWASRRFTLQEDLTKMVADIFWDVPDIYRPKSLIVAIVGDHFCEKIRGIKHKSITVTIEKRGDMSEKDMLIFMRNLDKIKEIYNG
jgi:GTP cyclohydrolase I